MAGSALGDLVRAGFRRVEDSSGPGAEAVAASVDRANEPGAAHAVRSAEQRRRPSAGRLEDRILGCGELLTHRARGAEGEKPMIEAVTGELVTIGEHLPEPPWVA